MVLVFSLKKYKAWQNVDRIDIDRMSSIEWEEAPGHYFTNSSCDKVNEMFHGKISESEYSVNKSFPVSYNLKSRF